MFLWNTPRNACKNGKRLSCYCIKTFLAHPPWKQWMTTVGAASRPAPGPWTWTCTRRGLPAGPEASPAPGFTLGAVSCPAAGSLVLFFSLCNKPALVPLQGNSKRAKSKMCPSCFSAAFYLIFNDFKLPYSRGFGIIHNVCTFGGGQVMSSVFFKPEIIMLNVVLTVWNPL